MTYTKSDILLLDDGGNFREVCCGTIAPGTLFRCSHPMADGEQDRAIALQAQAARIACVLNLCDAPQALPWIQAPWYARLVRAGKVAALGMEFDFCSPAFCKKLAKGLRFMVANPGPYLVHCQAGVDRTGFVAAVLEALMGATVREIEGDYLRSFGENVEAYFVPGGPPTPIVEQLALMNGGRAVTDETARGAAERFLRGGVGLSAEEVEAVRGRLG
jgi:hypothetical protein